MHTDNMNIEQMINKNNYYPEVLGLTLTSIYQGIKDKLDSGILPYTCRNTQEQELWFTLLQLG